jgi:hypothetical protein
MRGYSKWFAIVVAIAACGPATPDYKRLCEQQCACESCTVDSCVQSRQKLGDENAARGCAEAWAAVEGCEVSDGNSKCEHSGGLTVYMPQQSCRPVIDALTKCWDKHR